MLGGTRLRIKGYHVVRICKRLQSSERNEDLLRVLPAAVPSAQVL